MSPTLNESPEPRRKGCELGRPPVLGSNDRITEVGGQTRAIELVGMQTYIEAISASDSATETLPKRARMQPYTIEAGPPFNKENWKVKAHASHADWIISSKLIEDGRLMNI